MLLMKVFEKMECAIYICAKCPKVVLFLGLTEISKCASIVTVCMRLQTCLSTHTHHSMLLYVLCTSSLMRNFGLFVFLN